MELPLPRMESHPFACPECGAGIKISRLSKARRVQCPKCRGVVTLPAPAKPAPVSAPLPPESMAAAAPGPVSPEAPAIPMPDVRALQERIEALEARLAQLEKALSEATQEGRKPSGLKWRGKDEPVDFSPAQEEVLRHNLQTLPAHRITIQVRSGDEPARTRAEWFKGVFESARWAVSGPLHSLVERPPGTLAIATALPVSREMADTFLALRAAGFVAKAEFDPSLSGEGLLIVA
jgi:DNA-directed RNA polymerase subunit RPC12/RpoP